MKSREGRQKKRIETQGKQEDAGKVGTVRVLNLQHISFGKKSVKTKKFLRFLRHYCTISVYSKRVYFIKL